MDVNRYNEMSVNPEKGVFCIRRSQHLLKANFTVLTLPIINHISFDILCLNSLINVRSWLKNYAYNY